MSLWPICKLRRNSRSPTLMSLARYDSTCHYITPHYTSHSHCICLFFRHFSLPMTSRYHSGTWWHMCGESWVILHPSTRYPTMWHGSWQSYLNFSCGLSRLSIAGIQLTHGCASGASPHPHTTPPPLSLNSQLTTPTTFSYAGHHNYFKIEKAKKHLGYKPIVPLREGMRQTLTSFQHMRNRKRE